MLKNEAKAADRRMERQYDLYRVDEPAYGPDASGRGESGSGTETATAVSRLQRMESIMRDCGRGRRKSRRPLWSG